MKSLFNLTMAGILFSTLCINPLTYAQEMESDAAHSFDVPNNFAIKELYKKNNAFLFREDDTIFALGTFKKKFSLKKPDGKTISTARLYELVPGSEPLLVIRDDVGCVLGYIHLENSNSSSPFKPISSTVYDKHGEPTLKVVFPLTSQQFSVFSFQRDGKPIISTSKGAEGDLGVEFSEDCLSLDLDPVLLISVLHIHASKSLLTKLHEYTPIDEIHIDELGLFAEQTSGQCYIKEVEEDDSAWQTAEELVMDFID